MITIEDTNNEQFFINPCQVIYVKKRLLVGEDKPMYKILLSNGEVIMTNNNAGADSIIETIKSINKRTKST
jgi:hypothetical protein